MLLLEINPVRKFYFEPRIKGIEVVSESDLRVKWSETEVVCTHPDGSGGASVAVVNGRDSNGSEYKDKKYLVPDGTFHSDSKPHENTQFVHPREGFQLIAEFNTKPGQSRLTDEVANEDVTEKILGLMETDARANPNRGFWLVQWDFKEGGPVKRRLGGESPAIGPR